MPARVMTMVAAVVLAVGLAGSLAACSTPDEASAPSPTQSPTTVTTISSTTAPSPAPSTTTVAATSATTPPPAPPSSSAPPTTGGSTPPPGTACTLGSNPDCIDPLRTGQGVYLIGGADCMATSPDPALCIDLDGDGLAGYPDYG